MLFPHHHNKQQRKSSAAARTRRRSVPLSLEVLESRTLLSADTWINANGGNWDLDSNWDLGHAPRSDDTAVISTTAAATITIQSGDDIQVQSVTTGSNDTLLIMGGSLKVTAGNSTLSGPLSMEGGLLTVTGSGVKLTATGSTDVDGSSLSVFNGGHLALPALYYYASNDTTFEADGPGSVLDVSALVRQEVRGSYWFINATNGGTIDMSNLDHIGWGTEIGPAIITDTGNSRLLDGKLHILDGDSVTLDGTDPQVANSWNQLADGSLSITGGTYSLPNLIKVDGSNLSVSSGGRLALPGLTSYTSQAGGANFFKADGTGSVLDVSALLQVIKQGYFEIDAVNGGQVLTAPPGGGLVGGLPGSGGFPGPGAGFLPSSPSGNITALVTMTLTPASRKGKSRGFAQTLTITNPNGGLLPGPFSVVLLGLKSTVKLRSASGYIGSRKKKSPFVVIFPDSGSLQPYSSVRVVLQFSGKPNRFTPSVWTNALPR
jgi:hypothetical protein